MRKINKIQYADVKTEEAMQVFKALSIVNNLVRDGPLPVLPRISPEERHENNLLAMSFKFEQELSSHSNNVNTNIGEEELLGNTTHEEDMLATPAHGKKTVQ